MIINYNKYLTYSCKDLENIPLFESKGIPDIVKNFVTIIFNKLQSNVYNYFIDIDENNFKVKDLKITLKNKKSTKYYGSSSFGDFKDDSLIGSDILIRFDFNDWNENELKRILTHELIHIYEIYNRIISKSYVGLQWHLIKKIQEIRDDYEDDDFIHDLCLLIYYTSDQELNSIIAQVYPILYDVDNDDKGVLFDVLSKTKSYDILQIMKNFDYKSYVIDYDRLLKFFIDLNSTIGGVTNKDFIIFKIPKDITDCKIILKKYQKLFYKKYIYLEKKLNKIVDEVILDIKNKN